MKLSKHNMYIYASLLGVFSMFCITSCTKTLDGHFTGFTPKIGLNSIFAPDSVWKVNVFRTSLIFEPAPKDFIENAIVTITDVKSDVQFQLEYFENGVYVDQFNRRPEYGRLYQIDVHVEGFESVSSSSVVPSPVQVELVEVVSPNLDRKFKLEVHDNPTEENFYILEFDVINKQGPTNPIDIDPEIFVPVEGNFTGSDEKPKNLEIFLEDSDMGSDDNIYSIDFNSNEIEADAPSQNEEVKYLIKVRSVSKDLYLFLKSRDEYLKDSGNTSITTPTPIHTNIENGTGIFGAMNEQVFEK